MTSAVSHVTPVGLSAGFLHEVASWFVCVSKIASYSLHNVLNSGYDILQWYPNPEWTAVFTVAHFNMSPQSIANRTVQPVVTS